MPIHQWKTVVEEKATLNEVENNLVTATAIGSTFYANMTSQYSEFEIGGGTRIVDIVETS